MVRFRKSRDRLTFVNNILWIINSNFVIFYSNNLLFFLFYFQIGANYFSTDESEKKRSVSVLEWRELTKKEKIQRWRSIRGSRLKSGRPISRSTDHTTPRVANGQQIPLSRVAVAISTALVRCVLIDPDSYPKPCETATSASRDQPRNMYHKRNHDLHAKREETPRQRSPVSQLGRFCLENRLASLL